MRKFFSLAEEKADRDDPQTSEREYCPFPILPKPKMSYNWYSNGDGLWEGEVTTGEWQ